MKKVIIALALGLVSYQGITSAAETNNLYKDTLIEKNKTSYIETGNSENIISNKTVLAKITFTGDSNIDSIESQAIDKANSIGASHYKIVGIGGKTHLRGYVIFYK